jgi:hypothetical protein
MHELSKVQQFAIRFDDKTMPVFYESGKRFDIRQLGGGEKGALIDIVRTVRASYAR